MLLAYVPAITLDLYAAGDLDSGFNLFADNDAESTVKAQWKDGNHDELIISGRGRIDRAKWIAMAQIIDPNNFTNNEGWAGTENFAIVFNGDGTDTEEKIKLPYSCEKLFCDFDEAITLNCDRLDTSEVMGMSYTFFNAKKFNDTVDFDASSLHTIYYTFARTENFNQPVTFRNSTKLDRTSFMFDGAEKFNSAVTIDTSNVHSMSDMFSGAKAFNQPINFTTDKVEHMENMFAAAETFNQPINFTTPKLKNTSGMFASAKAFNQEVQLDTDKVEDAHNMFDRASSFTKDVNFTSSKDDVNLGTMFSGAEKIRNVKITVGNNSNAKYMFGSVNTLTTLETFECTPLKNLVIPANTFKENYRIMACTDGVNFTIAEAEHDKTQEFTANNNQHYKMIISSLVKDDISTCTVERLNTETYTGVAITPEPTIKFNGNSLTKDTDYTLSYQNNKNVGTAKLIITGKGHYEGEKQVDFSISKKNVNITGITGKTRDYNASKDVELDLTNANIVGNADGANLTIDISGVTASADNKNAGQNKPVTLTGNVTLAGSAKDNYNLTGVNTITVDINQKTLSAIADQKKLHNEADSGVKTVDLVSLLPSDAIYTTAIIGAVTNDDNVLSAQTINADNKLEYTLAGNQSGTAIIPLTLQSTNYANTAVNVIINVTTKSIPTVTVTNYTRDYNKAKVAISEIENRVSATFNNNSVEGKLELVTANALDTVKNAGEYIVAVNFVPTDIATYETVQKNIKITINKINVTGQPSFTKITESGKTLADAPLAMGTLNPAGGTLTWQDDNSTSVSKNTSYGWTYVPSDTVNYNKLTGSLKVWEDSNSGSSGNSHVDSGGSASHSSSRKKHRRSHHYYRNNNDDNDDEQADTTVKTDNTSTNNIAQGTYDVPQVTSVMTTEQAEQIVAKFADMQNHWARDFVIKAIELGLFKRVSDNSFEPNAPCTRAMLFILIQRMAGAEDGANQGKYWYSNAMNWAKAMGISDGLNPEQELTREQLVVMLYRFVNKPDTSYSLSLFNDASDLSLWAQDAMEWAVKNNIISGKDGKKLDPKGKATRAEVATILIRFLKK